MSGAEFVGEHSGVVWANAVGPDRRRVLTPGFEAWLRDVVGQPDPLLGRPGAVCPYVRSALDRGHFWITHLTEPEHLTIEGLSDVVDDAWAVYFALLDEHPAEAPLHTVIIMLPESIDHRVIDAVHAKGKSAFVRSGAMLGQFYPGCDQQGLWNDEFRPLDAPFAMLIVRTMLATDYPFLVGDREWLYAYLTKFAPDLPVGLRRLVADDLARQADGGTDIARHARLARAYGSH